MRRVDVDRDREMQTTTEQNIFAYTKFAVIFDFRFLVPWAAGGARLSRIGVGEKFYILSILGRRPSLAVRLSWIHHSLTEVNRALPHMSSGALFESKFSYN